MRGIVLAILVFSIPVLATSCAGTQKKTPAGNDEGVMLLARLDAYNKSIMTLEGNALIVYREGDKAKSFKASIRAHEDKRSFRLDLDDFVFRKHLVTIVKNGDEVLSILYFKKEFSTIRYSDLDIEALTGFDVPRELLIPTIMGKVYTGGPHNSVQSIDATTLRIVFGEYDESVYFDREWLPRKTVYTFEGENYELTFAKFQTIGDTVFPHKINVIKEERELEIIYTEARINGEIDQKYFDTGTPGIEGFQEVKL